jgi:hypothetical protein
VLCVFENLQAAILEKTPKATALRGVFMVFMVVSVSLVKTRCFEHDLPLTTPQASMSVCDKLTASLEQTILAPQCALANAPVWKKTTTPL